MIKILNWPKLLDVGIYLSPPSFFPSLYISAFGLRLLITTDYYVYFTELLNLKTSLLFECIWQGYIILYTCVNVHERNSIGVNTWHCLRANRLEHKKKITIKHRLVEYLNWLYLNKMFFFLYKLKYGKWKHIKW